MTQKHKIEIYTINSCVYCVLAKELLSNLNYEYLEYNVERNSEIKSILMDRLEAHKRSISNLTVPQIFINDQYVGGYIALKKWVESGYLDQ